MVSSLNNLTIFICQTFYQQELATAANSLESIVFAVHDFLKNYDLRDADESIHAHKRNV